MSKSLYEVEPEWDLAIHVRWVVRERKAVALRCQFATNLNMFRVVDEAGQPAETGHMIARLFPTKEEAEADIARRRVPRSMMLEAIGVKLAKAGRPAEEVIARLEEYKKLNDEDLRTVFDRYL